MSGDGVAPLERRGALSELSNGARAIWDGLTFVAQSDGAMKTALFPAAVAVGVGTGLAGLGIWGVVVASHAFVSSGGEFAMLGRAVFDLGFGMLVLFVASLVALAVAQPLSRAALDRLTQRLSLSLSAREPTLPSSHFFASMGTALAAIGVTLPAIGLIEALTAIAPEAAIVTEPLAFVVSALGLAWDLFDHPMSRRGMNAGARFRWMKQNALLVVGFGVAAQALLMMPVVDLFLLPVGVLGATKLLAMRGVDEPREPPPPPT
jgi:uncharacterized protein involved in cysteine biosynthesis